MRLLAAVVALPVASYAFEYGQDKIRGVNLVAVTRAFLDATGNDAIVDEWTFCQLQNRSAAEAALRQHWQTWITEDDFRQIKETGLNHVRIPVGHWGWNIGSDEPYIAGSEEYLDKAIGWARTHQLKVLLDLHGAPGSQNGWDHSGRKGPVRWWQNATNIQRTIDVVQTLSQKYGVAPYSDTVTMIGVLNEPGLFTNANFTTVTKQYYKDAYEVARYPWGKSDGRKTDWIIVIHDGFQGYDKWQGFMSEPEYEKVWIDDHYYQAFEDMYYGISAEKHIRYVCKKRPEFGSSTLPSIAGEWGISVWQCAAPEGNVVGDCNGDATSEQQAMFFRAYFEIQAHMYEDMGKGQGWFFFNWNTEDLDEWEYRRSLTNNWIPQVLGQWEFDLDSTCTAVGA